MTGPAGLPGTGETGYRVACSPITDTIYAGRTNKTGSEWASKSDVTTEACVAVAKHVMRQHDGAMTLRAPDGSGWDIEVTAVASASDEPYRPCAGCDSVNEFCRAARCPAVSTTTEGD